ncbi:MAG: Bro-N domain-containing protein [Candidatus Pacearchaeota archaeon]|nr:Bro-N domain-containing protein [Candidatus Pacearchaeota archaeon]
MKKKREKEEKESETHIAVFHGKGIRRVWYAERWWFVVEDIIPALTDSSDPKQYIQKLKQRDEILNEGWVQIVHTLLVDTEGGKQSMNCADTEGIFRIIQSIPSKKAEPFKRWLAKTNERAQCHKVYKDFSANYNIIRPSDPTGSLDDSFHALSPRYLLRDMPGFIFTFSGRFV